MNSFLSTPLSTPLVILSIDSFTSTESLWSYASECQPEASASSTGVWEIGAKTPWCFFCLLSRGYLTKLWTHTQTQTHICVYVYIYTYIYTHMYNHTHIYIYIDAYVYIYMCVCLCKYIYTYLYSNYSIYLHQGDWSFLPCFTDWSCSTNTDTNHRFE